MGSQSMSYGEERFCFDCGSILYEATKAAVDVVTKLGLELPL